MLYLKIPNLEIMLNHVKSVGFTVLLILIFISCDKTPKINKAEEIEKIMQLHNLQRTYHFEKMAKEFASQLSADHISVNRGEITQRTKDENVKRLDNYFSSVEFKKWDDLKPPVIRFSNDYSLAYTIVDKEVVVRYTDDEGIPKRELTKFSWVAIYKKYADGWKIDCVASTNKPGIISNIEE